MYPCVKMKMRRVAAIVLVTASTVLAGCSDIYYDRRETVSSGAADAVASNSAVQTVDPWPPNVANQNIAMNGDRAVLAARSLSRKPGSLVERFQHEFGWLCAANATAAAGDELVDKWIVRDTGQVTRAVEEPQQQN